jgi:predicted flap endonuclease-1-like 5' DNA nuclease
MDTRMQELSNSGLTRSADNAPEETGSGPARAPGKGRELDDLKQELAKWQERVPKLAAALRERTEHASELQAQIEKLEANHRASSDQAAAASKERQQRVDELHSQLQAQQAKHQELQSELQARGAQIADLRLEVADWKEKHQHLVEAGEQASGPSEEDQAALEALKRENASLAEALAEKTRLAEERAREVASLREDAESLSSRNATLFETTEFASKQLDSLGDNLGELRDELNARSEALREKTARIEALEGQLSERETELEVFREKMESAGVYEEMALELEESLAAERQEVERLQQCVKTANRITSEREYERRALSEELETLMERNQELEAAAEAGGDQDPELEQQRDLMLSLEEELAQAKDEQVALEKSHAKTLAEKERQLSELREELDAAADRAGKLAADESIGEAQPEHPAQDKKVEVLQQQVTTLEELIRERTEELNELKWRAQLADGEREAITEDDAKMMLVLNQQLGEARESNDRLIAVIGRLEERLAASDLGPAGDDFTRMRGIGDKLAAQLNELGIRTFGQIADIDLAALENDHHPLAAFKHRIEKDDWVAQARELAGRG